MLNAEFPAQVHLRLDDNWIANYATTDAYVDVRDLDSTNRGRRMRPRGIIIGRNGTDATATIATVKGVLWDENHAQADIHTLACGVMHPIAFKLIYANGTNGREIRIYG